jgi:hypothetical protein
MGNNREAWRPLKFSKKELRRLSFVADPEEVLRPI